MKLSAVLSIFLTQQHKKDWQYFSTLFYFEPFAIAGKWTVTLASSERSGRRRSDLALITVLSHFLGTFSR